MFRLPSCWRGVAPSMAHRAPSCVGALVASLLALILPVVIGAARGLLFESCALA